MGHVLIVDDNTLLRKTTREILAMEFPDLTISEASSGAETWSVLEKQVTDLVFMDIRLGRENGLDLTREIKAKYPRIAVAVFTNHDLPEYRRQAELSGAEYFLSKLESKAKDLTKVAGDVLSD